MKRSVHEYHRMYFCKVHCKMQVILQLQIHTIFRIFILLLILFPIKGLNLTYFSFASSLCIKFQKVKVSFSWKFICERIRTYLEPLKERVDVGSHWSECTSPSISLEWFSNDCRKVVTCDVYLSNIQCKYFLDTSIQTRKTTKTNIIRFQYCCRCSNLQGSNL